MTTIDRPVRRETNVLVQGRTLLLELNKFEVVLRRKGTRLRYAVPIDALWPLGAKIAKREQDRLNPPKKRGRK